MAKQQAIEFPQSVSSDLPEELSNEPLQLEEMLSLIKSASDLGYSVKDARDMKSLYDVVSSDLYSVWYALENEITIFAHNILDLIEFTESQRQELSETEDDITVDLAVAS